MKDNMQAIPDAPKPTCRVVMHKDDVHDLTVNKPVTLNISGTIKGITTLHSDEDLYEVEINDPLIEKVECEEPADDTEDSQDENLATMPKEKLKKIISQVSKE